MANKITGYGEYKTYGGHKAIVYRKSMTKDPHTPVFDNEKPIVRTRYYGKVFIPRKPTRLENLLSKFKKKEKKYFEIVDCGWWATSGYTDNHSLDHNPFDLKEKV